MGQLRVEVVYRRDHARLWRALLAFTGNPDLATEAETEAFAQAVRRGDGLDDVATWVWRAAFRTALDLMGAARTQVGAYRDLASDTALDPTMVGFIEQIGSLSDQQRACLVLRYAGGFTSDEIATLIGASAGTVRVQLHRAHAALDTGREPVRCDLDVALDDTGDVGASPAHRSDGAAPVLELDLPPLLEQDDDIDIDIDPDSELDLDRDLDLDLDGDDLDGPVAAESPVPVEADRRGR